MKAITLLELQEMLGTFDELTVVNVLPTEQYDAHHIPGSINVPLSAPDFSDQVTRAAGAQSYPVVVYCSNADCDMARRAADELEAAGFTNVFEFEDGIEGWEDQGLNIETNV